MSTLTTSDRAGLLTKRTLVIASHAIERAALAGQRAEPAVVLAMFQRLPYFEREAEVYRDIGALTTLTVVGMVSDFRPDLPPGVTPVLLRKDEELAKEWSVVVLSASFGACIVATDLEEIDFDGTSLEASRLFRGRWGFRREEAYAETVRLRDALGDRLPLHARKSLEKVLNSIDEPPAQEVERRTEAALRHLTSRVSRARDAIERHAARAADERRDARDPWTGLHTLDSLHSWLGDEVSDTIGLGLVVIETPELRGIETLHGASAAMHTENNIADVLRTELRPIDRAARLSGEEFLLVFPGFSTELSHAAADRVLRALGTLQDTYPNIPLLARARVGITSQRPIDLNSLSSPMASPPQPTPQVLSGTFSAADWSVFS